MPGSKKQVVPSEVPRKKAVIYCRVSSKKQTSDGAGLESQEHRCRDYARLRGYEVKAVFPDDVSGGGDFMNRPGMVALLAYLDAHPLESYVVIFDDLKRYARDTEFHLKLRREMAARNAGRECLNFKFEDSPEGEFIETIIAAQGELERKQNRRQVIQKMKARVEQGFWVFRAPVGYKYVTSKRGGKELVPDEPLAAVVREALEGYASGRLASQTEVKRFLEADPFFPKDMPNGLLRPQTVPRFLGKAVYAGYVEAPEWGVSLRKGNHAGLISFETFQKVQNRLTTGVYAPTRKDINEDFPLRGAVSCACCNTPLTAGWSKGKTKKHAYYRCKTKGCVQYGKSIPKAKIERQFCSLLISMQPSVPILDMASAMFQDAWEQQKVMAEASARAFKADVGKVEKKIDELLERIIETTASRVVRAYEDKIETLEREKLVLLEKAEKPASSKYTYGELFELSLKFLSNPYKMWVSGQLELQRLVLNSYSRSL